MVKVIQYNISCIFAAATKANLHIKPDAEFFSMLTNPRALHKTPFAKYAAAFFKMARSSFKRAFSLRTCLSSS